MNEETKQHLIMEAAKLVKWLVVVLVVGAFIHFGFDTGELPPLPIVDEGQVGAQGYQTAIRLGSGGDKLTVASGGEIQVNSGATLDVQSGATTDFSGGIDLDGALLDLDANGNTSLQADTDDQIDIEISGNDDFQFTANDFTALSGSTISANTIAETTAATGVTVDSLTIKDGGIQDAGGFPITGQANVAQLTVTGYSTQTNDLLVLEQSDSTDVFTVTNGGNTDIAGTLQYGSDDLYPVGYASSGEQFVTGTDDATEVLTVTHGLTTVTWCNAILGEDPSSSGTDAAYVTVEVTGNECYVNIWQDDMVTASDEADVTIHWQVIGTP